MGGRLSALEPTFKRLDNEFFNHDGGKGLKTIVLEHISAVNQRNVSETEFHNRRDQEIKNALQEHNRRADRRMNYLSILLVACGLALSYLTYHQNQQNQVPNTPPVAVQIR